MSWNGGIRGGGGHKGKGSSCTNPKNNPPDILELFDKLDSALCTKNTNW